MDGINGVFVIENGDNVLTLKMKIFRVLGANKRGETLSVHELGKNLLKEGVGGNILSVEVGVLVEDG